MYIQSTAHSPQPMARGINPSNSQLAATKQIMCLVEHANALIQEISIPFDMKLRIGNTPLEVSDPAKAKERLEDCLRRLGVENYRL